VNERETLSVIPISGLAPDSLGSYLASLGMLRVLTPRWPNVRACWRDGVFQIVGGPEKLDRILDELCEVAARRAWGPYERGWHDAQMASKKSSVPLALWQASAEERDLELLAAHVVPAQRVSFNPLLGTGGNAGKRDFSKGWRRAVDALATTKKSKGEPDAATKRAELESLLLGDPVEWTLEDLNAASWFSDANELCNSGQRPSRKGTLSPWAMALACEGLPFFAGGTSRRLGARARAVGAFPFVLGMLGSRARVAAPTVAGEAGRDVAEVWAPLWQRPMTLREVVTLFARGRAELGGRGVLTPSAFAVAVMRRGVDAGISEFRRFVLGRTTSSNSFEPRFAGAFPARLLSSTTSSSARTTTAASTALERVLDLIERLPADRKVGDRWRFLGLRGPIEAAMLRAAKAPTDPEEARGLVDAVVLALDRVDRNKAFRERQVGWRPLPVEWVPALLGDEVPCTEARLALAWVSNFPSDRAFALYRYGVEWQYGRFVHVARAPARWVWRVGPLASTLSDVVHRRMLDWEASGRDEEATRFRMPVASVHVDRFLSGCIDDDLLARWLSRLALIDWRFVPPAVRSRTISGTETVRPGGLLCLFGLFSPLFDLRPVVLRGSHDTELLPQECGARTPAVARVLASLLRTGQVDAAMRLAKSRYAMASVPVARSAIPWSIDNPGRLLASVLFCVSDSERAALVERWLRPRRDFREVAHG
jgi:CRISPR-associated protein Csx17